METLRIHPSGAKARDLGRFNGTTEVVPFPQSIYETHSGLRLQQLPADEFDRLRQLALQRFKTFGIVFG